MLLCDIIAIQNRRICYYVILLQISNVSGQWLLRYISLKNFDVKLKVSALCLRQHNMVLRVLSQVQFKINGNRFHE